MIVGLLLAAGGARRFGSQKLVAPLGETPLVRHAADALIHATDEMVVVVGSDSAEVTRALAGVHAKIVVNAEWERGLSSSIRCGILAVPPKTDAVLIALGDEPRVRSDVSRALIAAWQESGRPIVVARYSGVGGHPVLFAASLFAELVALDGDTGAKRVISRSRDRVTYVDIDDELPLDVDEPADLQRLRDQPPREESDPSLRSG